MQAPTVTVPQWAKPDAPNRYALFELFALLKLEGQWVRLSAADQRAVIGAPVFGKLAFRVNDDCTIDVIRSSCFGLDYEQATYNNTDVQAAVARGVRFCPSTFGEGIYSRAQ